MAVEVIMTLEQQVRGKRKSLKPFAIENGK